MQLSAIPTTEGSVTQVTDTTRSIIEGYYGGTEIIHRFYTRTAEALTVEGSAQLDSLMEDAETGVFTRVTFLLTPNGTDVLVEADENDVDPTYVSVVAEMEAGDE